MKTENKIVPPIKAAQSKPTGIFPPGVHYFRASDVWFIDTTATPHVVYIRDTQVKVQPGKFYLYNDPSEVSNG